ncbi:MAG TPA: DUF5691 domain-containing protein, partial [Saprospiraceae bacterium]|nr:DUF5691 domain-containing protein [Saprospiraceae bacterium]
LHGRALHMAPPLPALPEAAPPRRSPVPKMPQGRHAALADEWLSLLAEHQRSLPPELLPDLLGRAERDPGFWEKLRPALGARGRWLAQQHPAWRSLLQPAATSDDWLTADFATRLRLLQQARSQRPPAASAWLEQTWHQESADHRLAFLAALRTGLSLSDEDFLEKNLSAKMLALRLKAAELLALLPGSRRRTEWEGLAASLRGFPQAPDLSAFLARHLPDIEAPALSALFALHAAKQMQSARHSILQSLLRLLPPSAWGFADAYATLAALQADPLLDFALPALLEATVLHQDAAWAAAWQRFLLEQREHVLWQSRWAADLVEQRRSPELLSQVARLPHQIAQEGSALHRALAAHPRYWPALLLGTLLDVWAESAASREAFPSAGLRKLLEMAALHASPDMALALSPRWAGQESKWPGPWQTGWLAFWDAIRYRKSLAEHMAAE